MAPTPLTFSLFTWGAVVASSSPPSAASLSIPPSFASIENSRAMLAAKRRKAGKEELYSAKISEQHQFADQAALAERALADYVVRGGAKAFLYYFSYLDTEGYNSEPSTLGLKLGADHGGELPYVFGLLNRWKSPVPESDLKLQNVVMSYWTNFVKTLNPNGRGLPVWKSFGDSRDAAMVLDQSVGMRAHPRAAQLDLLRAHPAGRAY